MGPFGYAKEGMQVGDLKGAFVVTAPVTTLATTTRAPSVALILFDLGVLLTALGVVFVVVRRLLVRPIGEAVALAEEIANNNLAVPDIEVHSTDEIGQALLALNRMKNNLTAVVGTISGTVQQLANAGEEISAAAGQTAEIARSQAGQTQQTAMHEMSATVQESSHQAAQASLSAANAARQALQEVRHRCQATAFAGGTLGPRSRH